MSDKQIKLGANIKSPPMTAFECLNDDTFIRNLLEVGADINNVDSGGRTTLLRFLRTEECSVHIVKVLLHLNADVNRKDIFGESPLATAIRNLRDEEVIQALLEGGATVNTNNLIGKSPLCIAFRYSSNDVVKLLLDAGSSPKGCKYHESALHCATDFSHSGLSEDILKVLLETNVNVNRVNECGQSLMCFALQHGAKPGDIRLLLYSGASLNVCKQHSSPLICATCVSHTPIREDVVQLLLRYDACVGNKGFKVLQHVLRCCEYESGVIQLLLDLPGVDAYIAVDECDKSLLHLAVENPYCTLDAVKLLVNQKAQVHKVNSLGDTPLHCAVRNFACNKSVPHFLLQNGSPVNAKNKSFETPLMLAVKVYQPANILKELLLFGAHIGDSKFSHGNSQVKYELLEFLARHWESCEYPETRNSYRMLLKFFLLQNPECDVKSFKCDPDVISLRKNSLLLFMNKCLRELRKMDLLQVEHGCTFRMFVSRDFLSVEKVHDFNQILICLMKAFPVYFDIISARISRHIMEAEVKKLQVYTSKIRPDMLDRERIYLNSDVVLKISQYLLDDDLLKFILAFFKPDNQNNSGEDGKVDSVLGKRNSKQSSKLSKHPRLYH